MDPRVKPEDDGRGEAGFVMNLTLSLFVFALFRTENRFPLFLKTL